MKLQRAERVLLFLTLLFLPTQLGKHFWPQFAFIYSLPIDYLSPTLYFWDLLVLGLLVIFISQGKHINTLALNLFYFFMLTSSLSLLFGVMNIEAGLVRLEQYLIAGLFGVYIASVGFKKEVFWALALSVLTESILAIAQFLNEGTIGFWVLGERTFSISTPGIAKFDFYGVQFLRPYATFPHPNVLAAFLVLAIFILSFRSKTAWFRIAAFLGAVVTLLTVSRVAILAGLIFSMVLLKNKGRLLILIVFLSLLPVLYIRFSSIFNFDNLALTRREELSGVALTLWTKSPVLGVGLNNFIPTASDLLLSGPSRFLQPVHNIFLLSMSETGLIGLIGLISLIGFPIFYTLKLKSGSSQAPLILLVWGMMIFLSLFDHYFLTLPQGYRLLFFIWGLTIHMIR